MGSIARMRRSDRFIDEFGKDFCAGRIDPTLTWKIVDAWLAQEEGNCENVYVYVKLQSDQEHNLVLAEPYVVFSPEDDTGDDLVNRVCVNLGTSRDEAARRLLAADLIDHGDPHD